MKKLKEKSKEAMDRKVLEEVDYPLLGEPAPLYGGCARVTQRDD